MPSLLRRFRLTDRLLRLKPAKYQLIPSRIVPCARIGSPAGVSTLITSAPRSPSSCVQNGPAIMRVKSITRVPVKLMTEPHIRNIPKSSDRPLCIFKRNGETHRRYVQQFAGKRATQQRREVLAMDHQLGKVVSCLVTFGVQEMDQILGRDIARRTWRKRAAANTAK
mmetsp:Transcript_2828/g.4881  ORF Transcript_2828/g.4881 Transcript_2828/m.4881 type:complete len:167 (-) Transcript_2828:156-656(-)